MSKMLEGPWPPLVDRSAHRRMPCALFCGGVGSLVLGGIALGLIAHVRGPSGGVEGEVSPARVAGLAAASGDEAHPSAIHRHSMLGEPVPTPSHSGSGDRVDGAEPVAPAGVKLAMVAAETRAYRRVSMLGRPDQAPAPPPPPKPVAGPETRAAAEAETKASLSDNILVPADSWFAVAEPDAKDEASPVSTGAKFCARARSLGTAMTWARSPAEASTQAQESHKLVMLLHVSGNFENPGFT